MRKPRAIVVSAAVLAMGLSAGAAYGAAGDLDPSFGTGGIKTLPVTYPHPFEFAAADAAVHGTRPVVLGTVDGTDFGISKPLADGGKDPSFGVDGMVRIDFGGTDTAVAVAVQANGMMAAAGNTDGSTAAVAHYNADGTPDTAFGGGDGKVTIPLAPGDVVTDVAEMSGRIALSIDTPSANGNFKVVVLNSSGALDTTFNGSGTNNSADFGANDSAATLTFQPDGKLLVAGRRDVAAANGDDFAVARYTTGGAIDSGNGGFDTDGLETVDPSGGADDGALSISVDASDGIIVTGGSATGGATVRLNLDQGGQDMSFGGGGVVFFPIFGFGSVATDVAVGPDGRIAIFGNGHEAQNVTELQRINADGSPDFTDTTTGENATFVYDTAFAAGVAVDSNNEVVLAGNASEQPSGQPGSFVQRWTAPTASAPDSTFGGDGTIFLRHSEPRPASAAVSASVPGPGGTFYSSGVIQTADDGSRSLMVMRHLAGGELDSSFGTGGIATAPFGVTGDELAPGSLAVQPDGKIVVNGALHKVATSDYATIVARFNSDGTLDGGFDGPGTPGNGAFELDLGGTQELGSTVAIDNSGRIVLLGETNKDNPARTDPYLVRLTDSGGFDAGFGTGGVMIVPVGTAGYGFGTGIAIQPDGKIVFAGDDLTSGEFKVTRVVDGAGPGNTTLDSGFGTGGQASQPGISVGEIGRDLLALQPDGKIVHTGIDGSGDFAVVRYTAAGLPDTTFSGDGRLAIDFGGHDYASDLSLRPDGSILVAGYTDVGGTTDWALARVTAAGVPDASFSGDGMAVNDLGGANDLAVAFGPVDSDTAMLIGYGPSPITLARYSLTTAPQVTPQPPPATPAKKKCKKKKKKKHAAAAKKCKKKKKKK
jgi:uncharacterized delta-60 repeat protein